MAAGHPLEDEVLETLTRVRKEVNDLWWRVEDRNRDPPIAEEEATRVTFHFGQNVKPAEAEGEQER